MKVTNRLFALLLAVVMMIGVLPAGVFSAGETSGGGVLIVAGSDFQDPATNGSGGTYTAQKTRIETIIDQILDGYQDETVNAYGFFGGGDYMYESNGSSEKTKTGADAVLASVRSKLGSDADCVLVQGNHDYALGDAYFKFGNNDTDDYGVFVINEDNYESKVSSDTMTKATAQALGTYLADKVSEGYSKPIFVLSHVPLHYSTRTYKEKDAMYSNYIYEVLYEYGSKLNLFVLVGHDHAWGDDDYLGGSSIYLDETDTIKIPGTESGGVVTPNQTHFVERPLNFVYMNYGYTGYYVDDWNTNVTGNADNTLTMTSFYIEGDTVEITRWDVNGTHNLKSAGAPTLGRRGVTDTQAGITESDTSVVLSPKTVTLKAVGPAVPEEPDEITVTDDTTGISVTAKELAGVTVSKLDADDEYDDVEAYEIAATGFSGSVTVSIPVPDGISANKVFRVSDSGELTDMRASLIGGNLVFTASGLGTFLAAETAETLLWTHIRKDEVTRDDYLYLQDTDGVNSGVNYLIAGSANASVMNHNCRAQTVTISGTQLTADSQDYEWTIVYTGKQAVYNSVSVRSDKAGDYVNGNYYYQNGNDYIKVTALSYAFQSNKWTINNTYSYIPPFFGNGNITLYTREEFDVYTISNGTQYLSLNTGYTVSLGTSPTAFYWNITKSDNNYAVSAKSGNNTYYLRFNNNTFGVTATSNTVRLYQYERLDRVVVIPGEDYWLAMTDIGDQAFAVNSFSDKTALETYLKSIIKAYRSDDGKVTVNETEYTLSGPAAINLTQAGGPYTYTVKVDGVEVGSFKVSFVEKQITGVSCGKTGTVLTYCSKNANTGATITVTYGDGTNDTFPVTVDMLSGTFDTETAGEYPGLTVTFRGEPLEGTFTLYVENDPAKGDFPEFPNGGSVKVTKTGTGIDFQATGVAKIELSASGITVAKGVDVIVMLDTSSSMVKNTTPDGLTRGKVMADSMISLIDEFSRSEDGSDSDIRMAIASFNGYTYLAQLNGSNNGAQNGVVYTATDTADKYGAASFMYAKDIDAQQMFGTLDTRLIGSSSSCADFPSGTNYDYAFDTIYRLGTAIKAANAAAGEQRDLIVVFMSDGAAFQYNYFTTNNDFYNKNSTAYTAQNDWNAWLNGTYSGSLTQYPHFMNFGTAEDGKPVHRHWMAEAIKGAEDASFKVISPDATLPNSTPVSDQQYMYNVPGLGATMYTIGFCIYDDKKANGIDEATTGALYSDIIHNITHLATYDEDKGYLYASAESAADLQGVFSNIAGEIRFAAREAYFVDTMGSAFDLTLDPIVMHDDYGNDVSDPRVADPRTYIEVTQYKLDGNGDRILTPYEKLESVWKENGKIKSDMLKDVDDILNEDGVICAKTFYYNTSASEQTVDGITIAPETFYWKIGTIDSSEIVLSYFVYLTGALEGEAPAGSYNTNENADLFYLNWLDHNVSLDVASPALPWKAATVSYGFYLVNEAGEPIVNQTSGMTGSFTQAVKITNPILHSTVFLNNNQSVDATLYASSVLPEYYVLYDEDASYFVYVNSVDGSGNWQITNGKGSTTYVTGFNGNLYTNKNSGDASLSGVTVDYTHTTVWFAVRYIVQCYPDTVVIDYGLPVDIDVLANDMFGSNGVLNSIAQMNEAPANLTAPSGDFDKTAKGKYGVATIENGKITYRLNSMNMPGEERFVYCVNYQNGDANLSGSYYGELVIIPATTIYFEDSFAEFSDEWEDAGTALDKKQSEDRPGKVWLPTTDGDNIYGFDPAYTTGTTFSLGHAMKATASASDTAAPTATFTFRGTGFDIISLTDTTTGTIIVDVADEGGKTVRSLIVDTYYGCKCVPHYYKRAYTYSAGNWHPGEITEDSRENYDLHKGDTLPEAPASGTVKYLYEIGYEWVNSGASYDTLYQIPVINCRDLTYGTYDVTVRMFYHPMFRHTAADSYDFYLDAIRIYDPAKKSDEAESAYAEDHESFPVFTEVRDILIDSEAFGDGTSVKGAVFIDGFAGIADGGEDAMFRYTNFGPNNEVYLAEGQAIAFTLTGGAGLDRVHIGAKSVTGSAVLDVNGTKTGISTATELYYDVTDSIGADGTVVIRNGGEGILSITYLKVTYTGSADEPAMAFVNRETAYLAAAAVREAYIASKTVAFAPKLNVYTNGKTARIGDAIRVTVTAPADVTSLTVNGIEATEEKTNAMTGRVTWTATLTADSEETFTVSVVAGNDDGCRSTANETELKTVGKDAALPLKNCAVTVSPAAMLESIFG